VPTASGQAAPIGLAAACDLRDHAAHSGVPSALLAAFAELGVQVVPLRAELPRPLQRTVTNLLAIPLTRLSDFPADGPLIQRLRLAVRANKPRVHARTEMAAVRSTAVLPTIRRHPELSVCVQFGSEYRLPQGLRYVTYDDATIVQLWRSYPYPWMQAVPRPELERMIARQRAIFQRADSCCLTNHWAARSAIDDYGVDPERVVVTGEGARPLRAVAEHDWRTPCFLFVGREWERKNGPRVLRVFERVRAKRPDARLDVVGRHLETHVAGVTSRGLLPLDDPAARAQLDRLFLRATCLLLPSLLEPSALVFAEALQAGIPAIGGTAGGSDTIVGDAGIMVDPEDEPALEAAMLAMCDPQTLLAFAEAARRRAPLFTWRVVAQRVLRAAAPLGLDVSGFAEPL
jgi:glycosyltransferase involved in cell wall biosynthesis